MTSPAAVNLSAETEAELLDLLRGLNQLVRFALTIGGDEQAAKLLTRFLSLADAMFIPQAGAGNLALLGALMDRDPKTAERITKGRTPSETIVPFADVLASATKGKRRGKA